MQEYLLGWKNNINVSKYIKKGLKQNLQWKLEKRFCLAGILGKKNILNP